MQLNFKVIQEELSPQVIVSVAFFDTQQHKDGSRRFVDQASLFFPLQPGGEAIVRTISTARM